MNDGYILLAMAISRQAAIDYEREYRKFKKTHQKSGALLEVERFFKSDYGKLVTFGKAKEIMQLIRDGVEVSI